MKASIVEDAKESMTQSQKEYFLKEQMKAIKKELGEDKENDLDAYILKFEKIEKLLTKDAREEILKNIKKLKNSMSESYESTITRNYLDYIFELPFSESSNDNLDISLAKEVLDSEHCHLADVKERILEFLSIKKLNPDSKGTIICFHGPPGVGKTSFAKSIAIALDRKCVRIALGGIKDESEIRGHRKTYVGAMPGKIMQGMKQAGVVNPVFVLDEIDKLSSDFRGDPSSALLEVLDPEQNNTFKDHYMNIEYDLSKVMFIATANNVDTIPPALRDRMELINISGYCEDEKIEIAKRFIIPKRVKEGGLRDKDVSFSKPILQDIIRQYTKEFGVRELERQVAKIVRKVSKKKAEDKLTKPITLTKQNLKSYLGPDKFSDIEDNKNGVGVVTGLAWTPYGGEILKLECILIEEVGETILTGRLGEVMQESAKIAVSVIKNNSKKLKVDPEIFKKNRIHIHAPAGAIPKDGPSAGVSLLSSMVSLLTNQKIKDSIAMTGEITLTGKVLPVGGIREKVLAAIRSGIKLVILPKDCKGDFDNIPEHLSSKIEVKYVSSVFEIFKEIF
jgi:ATP-dependent Lon protease